MKRIKKGKPPAELTQWLRQSKGMNCTYSDMPGQVKEILHSKLLSEQGGICGYTGIRIGHENSHIEHLYPQTRCLKDPGSRRLYGAKRDVDHANVIAAFPKSDKDHQRYPVGAKSRGDWFDETRFIHPLRPDCAQQFLYLLDGDIAPVDKDPTGPARETITRLHLDHEVLCELRRAAIDELMELSLEQWKRFQKNIYTPDANGNLIEFCFVLDHACTELIRRADRDRKRREAIQRQQRKQR